MKATFIATLLFALVTIAGYVNHLIWSLGGLFSGELDKINEYIVAALGLIVPPVGVIHGIYLWFT